MCSSRKRLHAGTHKSCTTTNIKVPNNTDMLVLMVCGLHQAEVTASLISFDCPLIRLSLLAFEFLPGPKRPMCNIHRDRMATRWASYVPTFLQRAKCVDLLKDEGRREAVRPGEVKTLASRTGDIRKPGLTNGLETRVCDAYISWDLYNCNMFSYH